MSEVNSKIVGTPMTIPLRHLRLDEENPRLVGADVTRTQEEIINELVLSYDAIDVAESIAAHGFFANEALIVLPKAEDGTYKVMEGNRRFVALTGLADSVKRQKFFNPEAWDLLSEKAGITLDTEIPVSLVESRDAVYSIIGYRHVSGILSWTPFAQASFIAERVDKDGSSFETVAPMVGKKKNDVAQMYRNIKIAKQLKDLGRDTQRLEDDFSLITVAMGTPGIRDHIGAVSAASTVPGVPPIPDDKIDQLQEVVTWIYGDENAGVRVVSESRGIPKLGKVLGHSNSAGLDALRAGKTLVEAENAIQEADDDPVKRLLNKLKTALNALRLASSDVEYGATLPEVATLVENIQEEVNGLSGVLKLEDS